MIVRPRDNFKGLVKILDAINPFLIIISIIGLFCEFTALKQYVLFPNEIISVLFVIDFLLRIVAFKPWQYIAHGYGWVDFLASLPGFFFFLNNSPLFAIFKIIKVGRFFKIIRILRFLRVFSFLKRMKADSVWIQDRIMKIGITVVMIFVAGIVVIDNRVVESLSETEAKVVKAQYEAVGNDIDQLIDLRDDTQFYTNDSVLYNPDGTIENDYNKVYNLMADELINYLVVDLGDGSFSPADGIVLPQYGVIMPYGKISEYQNIIMISLLTTLLVILIVMIFYMGFVFAKDIQIVQLIIDSFDAGDDLLLKQEAELYRDENGELVIDPDDNEMINLLKAAAIKSEGNAGEDMLMGLAGLENMAGLSGMGSENDTSDSSDLGNKIESLEYSIGSNNRVIVEDAIKRLTPAIIKYIKKELKD